MVMIVIIKFVYTCIYNIDFYGEDFIILYQKKKKRLPVIFYKCI